MLHRSEIIIENEAAMEKLGASLAGLVAPGDLILLEGPLGAGKTTLARGLIRSFCNARDVPSPTFTLVETYESEQGALWHFDLYRLEKPEDVWELGLEEALDEAIALIEWPDRIEGLLPETALRIELFIDATSIDTTGRHLKITAPQSWKTRLANVKSPLNSPQENRID